MSKHGLRSLLFILGDYTAGALTGAATAAVVRAVVWPGFDLALAMLLGVGVGTLTHLAVGTLLSPLLGMFHVMVPGSLIGMYGGMLFAMRDAMQAVSATQAIGVGVLFGIILTATVRLYDRALRGTLAPET
jgi:hypothetical protein